MTIFEINTLQIACFMFIVNTQQLPIYFNDLFNQNSALHSHNTRQSSDYHISYTVSSGTLSTYIPYHTYILQSY